jgi:hypothetical protein
VTIAATVTTRQAVQVEAAQSAGDDTVQSGPAADQGDDAGRWFERATTACWVMLGLIYAIEAATIVRANRLWLAHRMPDDALYYLETARHMARGQGPTFDGLHRTNGFHPLWQAMAAVLALLFPQGGDTLLKAALLTNLALSLAAVILVFRLLRGVVGSLAASAAAVVSVHSTLALWSWVNGMESAAVLAALAVLMTALDRFDRRRDLHAAAFAGGASALVVLARVDMATVIWLVPVWMAWRSRHQRGLMVMAAWGVAAAGPIAAWAAFSLAWVGHVLPVSGSLKLASMSGRARQYGGWLTMGYAHFVLSFVRHYVASLVTTADAYHMVGFPLTLMALASVVVLCSRRVLRPGADEPSGADHDRTARDVLLVGLVLIAGKAVADLALLPFWAEAWYSAPERIAVGLLIGLGAYRCIALAIRHVRLVGVVLAGLAIAAVLPLDGLRAVHASSEVAYPSYWQDASLEAAAWISAHGPIGVYGSTDAGVLGYYLDPGRPVVNLDGLINDYRYASMLKRGVPPLTRYQAEDVRYLVGRLGTPGTQEVPGCAVQLWRSPQDVVYGGSRDSPKITRVPIRVYDLGSCPPA